MIENRIIAIFLAAGKSSRMGMNKLALPFGTSTIGHVSLRVALTSKLDHVFVVTREEDRLNWIGSELFRSPFKGCWTHVSCRDAEKGQAHSLQAGLHAALRTTPKGIMILLADQPFLSVKTLNNLIEIYLNLSRKKESLSFLAAKFQEISRPPVIFSPEVIPELLNLKGDVGARSLLQKLEGVNVEYDKFSDFLDIDTKADYERLKGVVIND